MQFTGGVRCVRTGAAILVTAVLALGAGAAASPDPEPFALVFQGQTFPSRDVSTFIMPGATLIVEATGGPAGRFSFTARDGVLVPMTGRKWRWTAPSTPGLYTLRVDDPLEKNTITLRAFVMVPARLVRGGFLNGYQIGEYPPNPSASALYTPPSGFIEVTKENQDTKLSPHFRLEQFVSKQEPRDRFPKYVVLQERLLLQLERTLSMVAALGMDADTLNVMSAYRTPFYNHQLGDVRYSTHQWGSAADIYVDTIGKDRMDDLNQDGRVDAGDSRFLYDLIEGMLTTPGAKALEGGMGWYPGTAAIHLSCTSMCAAPARAGRDEITDPAYVEPQSPESGA